MMPYVVSGSAHSDSTDQSRSQSHSSRSRSQSNVAQGISRAKKSSLLSLSGLASFSFRNNTTSSPGLGTNTTSTARSPTVSSSNTGQSYNGHSFFSSFRSSNGGFHPERRASSSAVLYGNVPSSENSAGVGASGELNSTNATSVSPSNNNTNSTGSPANPSTNQPSQISSSQPQITTTSDPNERHHSKFSIRFIPFIDHSSSSQALYFGPIERKATSDTLIPIGRYTEKKKHLVATAHCSPITFKSKVVSRSHAEVMVDSEGQWYIKDVKSSSGTFLNHVRLSPAGVESEYCKINDGDMIQLGVDFRGGGNSNIYKCVRMRVEVNGVWKRKQSKFNVTALSKLRALAEEHTTSGESTECSICLLPISPYQPLFFAPCSHTWHYKCIRPLIVKAYPHFSCPNCRAVFDLEMDVESNDEDSSSESDVELGHVNTTTDLLDDHSNEQTHDYSRSSDLTNNVVTSAEDGNFTAEHDNSFRGTADNLNEQPLSQTVTSSHLSSSNPSRPDFSSSRRDTAVNILSLNTASGENLSLRYYTRSTDEELQQLLSNSETYNNLAGIVGSSTTNGSEFQPIREEPGPDRSTSSSPANSANDIISENGNAFGNESSNIGRASPSFNPPISNTERGTTHTSGVATGASTSTNSETNPRRSSGESSTNELESGVVSQSGSENSLDDDAGDKGESY